MKVIELLPTIASVLKAVTEFGINVKDYKYIEMYDEYYKMRKSGLKYWYVVYALSEKYKISERQVIRIIRRLDKDVSK